MRYTPSVPSGGEPHRDDARRDVRQVEVEAGVAEAALALGDEVARSEREEGMGILAGDESESGLAVLGMGAPNVMWKKVTTSPYAL